MLKQKDSQKDDKISGILQQVKFEKDKNDSAGIEETNNDSPLTENEEDVLTYKPSQQ